MPEFNPAFLASITIENNIKGLVNPQARYQLPDHGEPILYEPSFTVWRPYAERFLQKKGLLFSPEINLYKSGILKDVVFKKSDEYVLVWKQAD